MCSSDESCMSSFCAFVVFLYWKWGCPSLRSWRHPTQRSPRRRSKWPQRRNSVVCNWRGHRPKVRHHYCFTLTEQVLIILIKLFKLRADTKHVTAECTFHHCVLLRIHSPRSFHAVSQWQFACKVKVGAAAQSPCVYSIGVKYET